MEQLAGTMGYNEGGLRSSVRFMGQMWKVIATLPRS